MTSAQGPRKFVVGAALVLLQRLHAAGIQIVVLPVVLPLQVEL